MNIHLQTASGINLSVGSANERRRYYVTSSVIGRAHTQNDPWVYKFNLQAISSNAVTTSDVAPLSFIFSRTFLTLADQLSPGKSKQVL